MSLENRDNVADEEIMADWYASVAEEPGFVGTWLSLLRNRQRITLEQQQSELGVDAQIFLHLQAMPLPRAELLASDAHRIAEACNLENPMAFVQAMILAYNLERAQTQATVQEFYQAAFDAEEDLDQSRSEE
jgi:hypothetical protein